MRLQDWIWTGEVAAALGVSTATVLRWERGGKIPQSTRTLGGSRRWRREHIEALVEGLNNHNCVETEGHSS